jgi:hypothetical protein
MSSWSFLTVGNLVQLPSRRKLWVESWRKTLGRGEIIEPGAILAGYRGAKGVLYGPHKPRLASRASRSSLTKACPSSTEGLIASTRNTVNCHRKPPRHLCPMKLMMAIW